MSELDSIVTPEKNSINYKGLFPEGFEVVVPIGENPDGNIHVIRSGNILRFRLRNSTILTSLNFELCLEVPGYHPGLFNESFSYAVLDEAAGINIEISPEIFRPKDTYDILFIYLSTVFSSFIGNGRNIQMNSAAIAMALKNTGVFTCGRIARYMEICGLYGKGFHELRRTQGGILINSQRVRDALVAQPVNTEKEGLIGVAQPISDGIDGTPKIVRSDTPSNTINVVARGIAQVERIVSPRVNQSIALPTDNGIDSFIKSLTNKSPARAIKLLEKAISENRYGEGGTARLKSILQTRKGLDEGNSNGTSTLSPNPSEFIDSLTGSLRDQIGQIEKQLKRGKKYGEVYTAGLQKHKAILEGRFARR